MSTATNAPRFRVLVILRLAAVMFLGAALFAFANRDPQLAYDYTHRIARALLEGHLGLPHGESWLNELVPYNGVYYSVFPLGSVLCQIPFAWLSMARHTTDYPVREVLAVLGAGTMLFLVALSKRYADTPVRRGFLIAWFLLGSWLLPNVAIGSSWQVALGFAVLGQLGALVFTLVWRRPTVAGFFFAMAFGNRTEILLLTPLFIYLLVRHDSWRGDTEDAPDAPLLHRLRNQWRGVAAFCVFPFALGVATLWYNYARFGSITDFGYTRIPGVLDEYWYKPGLFSWQAIPMNVREMFCTSAWTAQTDYPFVKPEKMGGSIISVCPFLLYLARPGQRDVGLRRVCWLAIFLLLAAVLPHGNAGGLRYAYRYALPLLPWVWLLFLDRRGGKISAWEWTLFALSAFATVWSMYLWFWTKLL